MVVCPSALLGIASVSAITHSWAWVNRNIVFQSPLELVGRSRWFFAWVFVRKWVLEFFMHFKNSSLLPQPHWILMVAGNCEQCMHVTSHDKEPASELLHWRSRVETSFSCQRGLTHLSVETCNADSLAAPKQNSPKPITCFYKNKKLALPWVLQWRHIQLSTYNGNEDHRKFSLELCTALTTTSEGGIVSLSEAVPILSGLVQGTISS